MEDKKINEDKLFIFDALLKADKFVVKDVTKYYYCRREGSATTREFDQRWFDSLDIADMMEKKILKENLDSLKIVPVQAGELQDIDRKEDLGTA